MIINYRIFNAWHELDKCTESKDFMCYSARDKVIALNYSDMRRLFMTGTKSQLIESNAKLTMTLADILSQGKEAGAVEL